MRVVSACLNTTAIMSVCYDNYMTQSAAILIRGYFHFTEDLVGWLASQWVSYSDLTIWTENSDSLALAAFHSCLTDYRQCTKLYLLLIEALRTS